jgi:excisionase family DNA binding protein
MAKATDQKLSYSIAECARHVGCGRDKVYEAIREKRLIARKFGRRTVILAEDFRTFLDSLPELRLDRADA